jgi:hypothetical protein
LSCGESIDSLDYFQAASSIGHEDDIGIAQYLWEKVAFLDSQIGVAK